MRAARSFGRQYLCRMLVADTKSIAVSRSRGFARQDAIHSLDEVCSPICCCKMEGDDEGDMNSGAAKPRRTSRATAAPGWTQQLEDWQASLAACGDKPTRKRVHLLRVATLRLQAQIHYWLTQHENDHPEAPIALRWNKEAKHLRRALGAVRAYDVHLARLSEVRSILTAASGYQPRTSRATLRQLDDLEGRIKDDRKSAMRDLKQELAVRHDRLDRAASAMAVLAGSPRAPLHALTDSDLSAMFTQAAASFSHSDPDSLHDFRKHLKGVRYLAELAASGPESHQLAASVKIMQGAIGDWHDWEELSVYAKRMLRRKEAAELFNELDILMSESLQNALTICTEITAHLLPGSSPEQVTQKKPVRREEASGRVNAVAI